MLLDLYRKQKLPKRVKTNPKFSTFAEISYTDIVIAMGKEKRLVKPCFIFVRLLRVRSKAENTSVL